MIDDSRILLLVHTGPCIVSLYEDKVLAGEAVIGGE